MFQSVTI